MSHPELIEAAKEAINAVFADTSVERAVTVDSLEEILADVQAKLDAIGDDEGE